MVIKLTEQPNITKKYIFHIKKIKVKEPNFKHPIWDIFMFLFDIMHMVPVTWKTYFVLNFLANEIETYIEKNQQQKIYVEEYE